MKHVIHIFLSDWITDERTRKLYLVDGTVDTFKFDVIQQKCQNKWGFLPEPRNEHENKFLDSLGTEIFALGMRKNGSQWTWVSDGTAVGFTSWLNVNEQDGCAVMLRNKYNEFYWWRSDGWASYPCLQLHTFENKKSLICQHNRGMWMLSTV